MALASSLSVSGILLVFALGASTGAGPRGSSLLAENARAPRPAAAQAVVHTDADQRRVQFVVIVGALALVVGIAGFVIVQRQRRRAREQPRGGARATPAPGAPKEQRRVVCPTCRAEYTAGAKFCMVDGNRLVPQLGSVTAAPLGAVCPVCGQGFDPGVPACPAHGEPLVPFAVYHAERPSLPSQQVCPTCGSRSIGEAQFCSQDGSTLVPLN